MTGDAAAYGNDVLHGVQMKIDELGTEGLLGRTVELIVEDGRCTANDGANAARKLVSADQVIAIIGAGCSGETMAAAPIVEGAEIVMISPMSSSPDITHAGDFVFRTYPSDGLKMRQMYEYLRDNGYERIALLTENTDFAVAFREGLLGLLPESQVVFDEMFEPGTKDFRSLMTRLSTTNFDILFANPSSDAVLAVMLEQMREQGLAEPVFTHDVGDSLNLIQVAGEAAEGLLIFNVPDIQNPDFEKIHASKYGDPQMSLIFVAHGYVAADVLFNAIRLAGTEGVAIRNALYAMPSRTTVIGDVSFDENGDVMGVGNVLKMIDNGQITEVEDL